MLVLAFDNTFTAGANDTKNDGPKRVKRYSNKKYFLSKVKITGYNVLIDGRNFYDQHVNDLIKKYDEIRKIATGHVDIYKTGCLLRLSILQRSLPINSS